MTGCVVCSPELVGQPGDFLNSANSGFFPNLIASRSRITFCRGDLISISNGFCRSECAKAVGFGRTFFTSGSSWTSFLKASRDCVRATVPSWTASAISSTACLNFPTISSCCWSLPCALVEIVFASDMASSTPKPKWSRKNLSCPRYKLRINGYW